MFLQHRVLLLDEVDSILTTLLEKNNCIVDFCPQYGYQDVLAEIDKYEVLVVRSKIDIDKTIIQKATKLKIIARSGAGMDSIDTDYCQAKGIICLNSPEGNQDAVAEHTIGLILCLMNKINISDRQVRQFVWDREGNRGIEIKGKTIGIIGYGHMGSQVAKRLSSFGCQVIAYDKYKTNFSDQYVRQCSLQEIFSQTDILTLHVPLTKETQYMVDTEFINKFKKNFFLINASRGKVVNLKALIPSLQKGKILGCGLDVLEKENFVNNTSCDKQMDDILKTLFSMDNVVLTPHVAGWTKESYHKLALFLAEKIIANLNTNK